MKRLVAALAVASAAWLAAPAHAADILGGGDSTKDNYVAPTKSWTGVYVGISGGISNTSHKLSVEQYREAACYCGDVEPGEEWQAHAIAFNEDGSCKGTALGSMSRELLSFDGISTTGFVGGIDLGLDKQVGRFVIGIRGQYNWSNAKTELSVGQIEEMSFPGLNLNVIEKEEDWNLVARVGLLLDGDTLAYVLGGWSEADYRFLGLEKTLGGWVVGGGMEHRLFDSDLYANIEYMHIFYDEETLADGYDADDNQGLRLNNKPGEDRVTAGIKYKPSLERQIDQVLGF